jgi:plasmid stability protein
MHYGFLMATITLKNLPESLHGALKKRAHRHGRSLNREVVSCLEAAISVSQIKVDAALASVDRVRCGDDARLDEDLLEGALTEGRP